MDDNGKLSIDWYPPAGKTSNGTIVARYRDRSYTDRLDLAKAKDRDNWVGEVCKRCPALDSDEGRDQIARKLERLAAKESGKRNQIDRKSNKDIDHRPEVVLPGGPVSITKAAQKLGQLLSETGRNFIRGRSLVNLVQDDDGAPILSLVTAAALCSTFESIAKLRVIERNGGPVPTTCTEQTAKLIMHADRFIAELPVIRLIARSPVLNERKGHLVQITGL